MSDAFTPVPDDHFTFGLWTVGNPGRDPFGHEVRAPLDPVDSVKHLAGVGAYGVSFHDDDLVPVGSSAAERDAIVARFQGALDETGLRVPMATCNLFSQPVFRDGAFTANDVQVRRFALAKTLDAIDLGVELGAEVFVMWGGREGCEVDAAMDTRAALDRYAEAVNLACEYVRRAGVRAALRARAQAQRAARRHPAPDGGPHARVHRRARPSRRWWALNPEFAHETMSGLSFHHAVAQTLWHGKLFHIDLNAQRPGKYDQDFRFGSEGIRDAFYLVKLLEDAGYDGMRHFDAHPYRTEDADGVWDFARGCIRTYLILRDKARRFHEDPEIQAALARRRSTSSRCRPGPRVASPRCAPTGPIPSRSRNPASGWSGSTSWSTSCCSASADLAQSRRLVRAISPSQRADGFTVRSNVVGSKAMRPNVILKPDVHSKLSSSVQCRYPRTSIPSAIARARPLSAPCGVLAPRVVVGGGEPVLGDHDRPARPLGGQPHRVLERLGVDLPTGLGRRRALGWRQHAVGADELARVGLHGHEVVVARHVEPVELRRGAHLGQPLLAARRGLHVDDGE